MLRRLLRQCKRALSWAVELKGGIMLAMPARGRVAAGEGQLAPGVREISAARPGLPMSDATLMKRREAGHVLFGLEDDGRLAAYGWVSGAGCTVGILHDMTFEVPARSIYIWDCYTAPEARNRGRFQALLGGILDRHPDIGTAFVAVDVGNKPSRRALEKTGFRPLFRYYGLRLFQRPVMGIMRGGRGIVRAQNAFDRLTSGPGGA